MTRTSRPAGTDETSSDPVERARLLARVHDAVLSGSRAPGSFREVVSASWQRSLDAHVDPDRGAPRQVFADDELADLRASHPLAAVMPLLRGTLLDIADEAMHVMIVTDAQGHILWREGQSDVLRRADEVSLVEGTRWSEESIGTNAMGTALASGRAVQIHSAEHLVRTYHQWTCAAAPIHDPDTGEFLGAVDLTAAMRTFHPSTLALVTAAARLAENHLATRLAIRDEALRTRNLPHLDGLHGEPGALLSPRGRVLAAQPHGWLPERIALPGDGDRIPLGDRGEGVLEPLAEGYLLRLDRPRARAAPTLVLPFLGADRPVARVDGRPVRLSLRHAELLTLLALHPDGLSADGLATALHGDDGNPVTARSEVHRLRTALLGGETGKGLRSLVSTQPYRVHARVDADFLDLRATLRAGQVPDPPVIARGALLPASDAPGVREVRDQLEAGVRGAVLRRGDAAALWALARTPEGRLDPELTDRLLQVLPASDPRHAELVARTADPGSQWGRGPEPPLVTGTARSTRTRGTPPAPDGPRAPGTVRPLSGGGAGRPAPRPPHGSA